jgi:hypothetical protein
MEVVIRFGPGYTHYALEMQRYISQRNEFNPRWKFLKRKPLGFTKNWYF